MGPSQSMRMAQRRHLLACVTPLREPPRGARSPVRCACSFLGHRVGEAFQSRSSTSVFQLIRDWPLCTGGKTCPWILPGPRHGLPWSMTAIPIISIHAVELATTTNERFSNRWVGVSFRFLPSSSILLPCLTTHSSGVVQSLGCETVRESRAMIGSLAGAN